MPIEIRELVIKAFVDEKEDSARRATTIAVATEQVIADCVQQVMELLKQERER